MEVEEATLRDCAAMIVALSRPRRGTVAAQRRLESPGAPTGP